MVKVTWTKLAINDLDEIETYISQDSVVYAISTIEKIFSRANELKNHPLQGRIVPEFSNKNIRELIEGNYRIIYLVINSKEITIARIHHTARLLN